MPPPAGLGPGGMDDDRCIVARVFRSHHAELVEGDAPGGAAEDHVRRGPMLAVPIMWTTPQGGVPLGVATLSGQPARQRFTAGDQKLLGAIASQIGTAIQINRLVTASVSQQRLAHEMQLAHDLQMRMLPSPASVAPEAICAARVQPAQSVGGDFYHLIRLGDGRTGVLIGDVSSHGYQAALIMALTMSAMSIHAQSTTDPAVTITALLGSLADELRQTEMFLSLCYVVIDPAAGELRYTNTGHPHAFVIASNGEAARLGATDPPLGLGSGPLHAARHAWTPGADLLVLFTDGISDARDDHGAALGESQVLDVIRARRQGDPRRVVDGVFALLEGHMGSVAAGDDQAIVVVRT